MLRVWVNGCDPGRVSDGSRLALCQTLSIECPSLSFSGMCIFVILVPFSSSFLFVCVCVFFFFCSHWSLVDVPLIFFCPVDHVPDWQPRILLGMVEARSVNVKKYNSILFYFLRGEIRNTPAQISHALPKDQRCSRVHTAVHSVRDVGTAV